MASDKWSLRIDRDLFGELYDRWGISSDLFSAAPQSDSDLIDRYLPSKLWRLNNLYTVVNRDGDSVLFRMNDAQHRVYAASLEHPRLIILKTRQRGISTFWLMSFFDDIVFRPTLHAGMMAQGEDEAKTLLTRVKFAWDMFPPEIKDFLGLGVARDNAGEMRLSHNSSLYTRTSFRSATLHRLHISEYGKIANRNPERAKETKRGTMQAIKAGNPVIIESTAEGENDFKDMWEQALITESKVAASDGKWPRKAFKPVFLSWIDDPDCESEVYEAPNDAQVKYFNDLEREAGREITPEQRNFWIDQFNELGEGIYQEYPATPEEAFRKINLGTYYGILFNKFVVKRGRIVNDLYDPNIEVNVALDLGIRESDLFVLVYFQRWEDEWRIIDEYSNFGEGLEHYVNHMRDTGYNIGTVVAPHDIKVRPLGKGAVLKSREESLYELGVGDLITVQSYQGAVADGIESVRRIIPELYIDSKCTYIIDCFKQYSREHDDKNDTWKATPRHDKWSNGADAVRMMARSGVQRRERISRRDQYLKNRQSVADGMAF